MQIAFLLVCLVIIFIGFRQVLEGRIHTKDTFIPALTVIVEEKPDKIILTYDSTLNNPHVKQIANIKNIILEDATASLNTLRVGAMTLRDAFEFSSSNTQQKNFVILTTIGVDKVGFFVRQLEFSTKTIVDDQVIIGYTDELQRLFIDNVYKSFKETPPKYMLKKVSIPTNRTVSKDVFEIHGIDLLFIFETLSSERYVKLIDRRMKMEVIDYADLIDYQKLKLHLPHAKKRNIDFSLTFTQLQGKFAPVRSVLTFDILLLVPKTGISNNIDKELNAIIQLNNQHSTINYYGQYFALHPLSLVFSKKHDLFALSRDSSQILEQFANQIKTKDASYEVNQNVYGFFDSMVDTLTVTTNIVHTLPLKVGTRMKLMGQLRDEENGLYEVKISNIKQSVLKKVYTDTDSQSQLLNKQFEAGYLCYDHPEITSKGLCDSTFDEMGQTKRKPTYWDKPCKQNTDCPFYQSNKNYLNYRGGCIDGRCEMPVGVKSLAYRLYDTATIPLCYNCKNPKTFDCCQEQKDKKNYPALKGPDYVFELDQFERSHKSL